jgi:pyrroloquinoline quinone biosynthesis protein E
MAKDGSAPRLDGQGKPLWLLLELTYRCPLHCTWCNNPLDLENHRDELATEEWKRVLHEGRALGSLQLGFSGGEPLQRRDLEELVGEASRLGYYTNLITSGMGLTESRLAALKSAGLNQIQLSLQSCDPATNDALVGAPAFEQKISALRMIKQQGFPVVLNAPLCRHNIDQVEGMLALAEEFRVNYLEFANIQYYNWALLNRPQLLPTEDQIRRAEAAVAAAREHLGRRMTIYFVIPDYFDRRPKACMNGWGAIHLTVSPNGQALPCQEARVIPGLEFPSVREKSLEWIWRESPVFNAFRGQDWMKEPCRSCDEREQDFGGCRCQAFLLTGDAANPDPVCDKSPYHHRVVAALEESRLPEQARRPLVFRRPKGVTTAFLGKST